MPDSVFFRSDNLILYGLSLTCLVLIAFSFRYSRRFAFINSAAFLLYSSYMYYGLFFDSHYGTALVWWFYTGVATLLHIAIVGGNLIAVLSKMKKKKKKWHYLGDKH